MGGKLPFAAGQVSVRNAEFSEVPYGSIFLSAQQGCSANGIPPNEGTINVAPMGGSPFSSLRAFAASHYQAQTFDHLRGLSWAHRPFLVVEI